MRDRADDRPATRPGEARRAEVTAALALVEGGDRDAARELFGEIDDWAEFRDPLRYQLERGQLRYVLAHPADFADDTARELYSALLERHAGDGERLAEVRAIGATLHELERQGQLPRVMVVRAPRRRE
ncbi:MAG: hypothetical protein IPL61_40620 [Myxococcales bacterium]|nr:hypothetical protein [Myxococcales bacterium]